MPILIKNSIYVFYWFCYIAVEHNSEILISKFAFFFVRFQTLQGHEWCSRLNKNDTKNYLSSVL
uniref:Glycoprotein 105 n=1 Tax=Human herpesvirus 6B TaxID=32604 RepID=A0A2L2Q920_HHV6H|nr:Glycoprotein 105 [Human betaherpesvirus 6B]